MRANARRPMSTCLRGSCEKKEKRSSARRRPARYLDLRVLACAHCFRFFGTFPFMTKVSAPIITLSGKSLATNFAFPEAKKRPSSILTFISDPQQVGNFFIETPERCYLKQKYQYVRTRCANPCTDNTSHNLT